MGITIYYQGQLRDLAELPQLITELQATCERLGWACYEIDERILGTAERYETVPVETDDDIPTTRFETYEVPVDDRIRGVMIGPPGCEPLFLTFGRTGRLVWYGDQPADSEEPGRYGLIVEHLWCKTQFSSPETHVQVCDILRMVEQYAAEWEVHDDGGYWETRDFQVLQATWARYQAIFDTLSDPGTLQDLLESTGIDAEVDGHFEVGKAIEVVSPAWRDNWGISAGEN